MLLKFNDVFSIPIHFRVLLEGEVKFDMAISCPVRLLFSLAIIDISLKLSIYLNYVDSNQTGARLIIGKVRGV